MQPLIDYNTRHFYPRGGPIEMRFHRDHGGLTEFERKGLLKLGIMPNGELEVRETPTEIVDGKPRMVMTNREVFDFTDGRSKMRILLDIRGIKDAIANEEVPFQVGDVNLTMDAYLEFLQAHNPEDEHLARIDKKRLEVPGIYAIWPSGEMLLIDGVHRYIKRFRLGKATFRVIVIPTRVWQAFMLDLTETVFFDGTTAVPYAEVAKHLIKARP